MYGASKPVIATHGQDEWPTSPTEDKRRRKNEEDFEHILSVCLPYRKVKNRILKKSDKSVNNQEEESISMIFWKTAPNLYSLF